MGTSRKALPKDKNGRYARSLARQSRGAAMAPVATIATCGTVSIGSWPHEPIGEDAAVEVRFSEGTFSDVPKVVAQLAALDAHSPKDKRIVTWVSDVTRSGFRLHASSWSDSVTWNVKVTWVATSDESSVQVGTEAIGRWPDFKVSPDHQSKVSFEPPFACVPDSVAVGISGLDAQGDEDLQLWTDSCETNCRGFSLRCSSWSRAVTWSTTLAWVASSSPAALQSGSVVFGGCPYREERSEEPICNGSERVVEIRFSKVFYRPPLVAVALGGIDADRAKPLRVDTWADEIREDGFKLHVRSWENSITHRVRLTWYATPASHSPCSVSSAHKVIGVIPPHHPPSDYEVLGTPLGQGWWGVTHKARHIGDGQTYAVKTCKHSYRQHEEYLKHELENLALLPVHQNLLRYHACILQADRLHIVTECLDAFKLADLVPGCDGPFPRKHSPATILRWMAQLLDGLASLHKVGMVHRDLHGENILVERDVEGMPSQTHRAVRIIDFGVAKVYDSMCPRHMSNAAGCSQYCSPERRRGAEIDDRDDVWAVGCHLTELASGRTIRNRKGCGNDGEDFALCPTQVAEAIRDCDNQRCCDLAEAVLVIERSQRPVAAAARDLIWDQLLDFAPGKRRNATITPPAGTLIGSGRRSGCTGRISAGGGSGRSGGGKKRG